MKYTIEGQNVTLTENGGKFYLNGIPMTVIPNEITVDGKGLPISGSCTTILPEMRIGDSNLYIRAVQTTVAEIPEK